MQEVMQVDYSRSTDNSEQSVLNRLFVNEVTELNEGYGEQNFESTLEFTLESTDGPIDMAEFTSVVAAQVVLK